MSLLSKSSLLSPILTCNLPDLQIISEYPVRDIGDKLTEKTTCPIKIATLGTVIIKPPEYTLAHYKSHTRALLNLLRLLHISTMD